MITEEAGAEILFSDEAKRLAVNGLNGPGGELAVQRDRQDLTPYAPGISPKLGVTPADGDYLEAEAVQNLEDLPGR